MTRSPASQADRFKEAARAAECDEDEGRREERLKKGEATPGGGRQARMSGELTFAEWIEHEAKRIAYLGLDPAVPAELREEYIAFKVRLAMQVVLRLAREGLQDDNAMHPPR